jgi:hypothetical protein
VHAIPDVREEISQQIGGTKYDLEAYLFDNNNVLFPKSESVRPAGRKYSSMLFSLDLD